MFLRFSTSTTLELSRSFLRRKNKLKTTSSTFEKHEIKRVYGPSYPSLVKESSIVAVSETKGAHLPSTQNIIGDELNSALLNIGRCNTNIKPNTKQAHECSTIRRLEKLEDEQQRKRRSTGEIKFVDRRTSKAHNPGHSISCFPLV